MVASLDASLDNEEETSLETLEWGAEECWEVDEGSEPGVERSGTVERSLEGQLDEWPAEE